MILCPLTMYSLASDFRVVLNFDRVSFYHLVVVELGAIIYFINL